MGSKIKSDIFIEIKSNYILTIKSKIKSDINY